MPSNERISAAHPRIAKPINDALDLAAFAVESGVKTNDGASLPIDVIATIQTTAAKLDIFSNPFPEASITAKEWNDFEQAYYRLAVLMSPVTAETLRDTEGTSRSSATGTGSGGGPVPFREMLRGLIGRASQFVFGFSPAQRFARGLWLVAICFALFVISADWLSFKLGLEAEVTDRVQSYKRLFDLLSPWAYGGLGSCAYLLRSAHMFIYQRSFDLRRKPEYFNRILLGAISGGAIILFTKYLADEEGGAVELSSAAVGFIAGYSTDFLFNTIERIVTAIFPRVAVETVPKNSSKTRVSEGSVEPKQEPESAEVNDKNPK